MRHVWHGGLAALVFVAMTAVIGMAMGVNTRSGVWWALTIGVAVVVFVLYSIDDSQRGGK